MTDDDGVGVVITDRDGEIRDVERVSHQEFNAQFAHDRFNERNLSVDELQQQYVDGEIDEAEFERRIEAALQHDEADEQAETKLLDEKGAEALLFEKLATGFVIGIIGTSALSIAAAFYLSGAYIGLAVCGSLLVVALTAWIWGFI